MSSDPAASVAGRIQSIDFLRAVAILLVIGRHLTPRPDEYQGHEIVRYLFGAWRQGGWVGVDLFFVLSGFLISGLLFTEYKKRQHISILRFYIRRGLKIYPSFYLMLFVTCLISLAYREPYTWTNYLSELFFLQSYLPGVWRHTWSLAVEEHFYLLLPILLFCLARTPRRMRLTPSQDPFHGLIHLTATLTFLCLGLRIVMAYTGEFSYLRNIYHTHIRVDSMFVGVALSYVFHYRTTWWCKLRSISPFFWFLGGGLLLVPCFLLRLEQSKYVYTLGFTLNAIASAMILVGSFSLNHRKNILVRSLAYLGAYSYSIYLWHVPIIDIFFCVENDRWLTDVGFIPRFLIISLICFVVGIAFSMCVEYPVLKMRDRLIPK